MKPISKFKITFFRNGGIEIVTVSAVSFKKALQYFKSVSVLSVVNYN